MDHEERPPVFPYHVICEEYGPSHLVTWERLQQRAEHYGPLLALRDLRLADIPDFSQAAIHRLIEQALERLPSPTLTSRLYWLAGWQVEAQYRARVRSDLASQRPAIKRLQQAAEQFWQATGQLSGHAQAVLDWVHAAEPGRLLPEGRRLDLSYLGSAAYDASLAAARMYEDTKPKRTGRRPAMRRDTTVRMAAQAIEEETGDPITMSRGNKVDPAPHFTNAGGRLLRDFFRLIEPKTDERLLVQSLDRARKRTGLQKNSR